MSGVKQGFWERGATDQKAKRTNEYLSVEVRGLEEVLLRRATGRGGMTAYYAVNYDGNLLLIFLCRLSARSNPSSDFVVKIQKTHENVCFCIWRSRRDNSDILCIVIGV